VNSYSPTIWEITLGVGGIALALLIVQIAVRVLRFLPDTLDDSAVDPHAAKAD
jgi:molybdopterin-containing oxidoreductase family membrane subunit